MSATVTSGAQRPLVGGTIDGLRDVAGHLELLRMLVIKDLKIRYKASALGLFWSLLNPLLLMIVYSVIFGAVLRNPRPEFPIFILSGLLAWNFFGTALPLATIIVVANANLVKRTRFPISLLPISVVISGMINYLISLVLLFGLLVFYRHGLGPSIILLPVLIAAQLLFTAGLGLLLSGLNVFFRDIEHFLGIAMTVWFFATPIIYPRDALQGKAAGLIVQLNPMTWLVGAYQDIFYGSADHTSVGSVITYAGTFHSTWPNPRPLVGFAALAIVLALTGFTVFTRLSHRFPEEV
jgi:lipopolysaccharide transport system permease protein